MEFPSWYLTLVGANTALFSQYALINASLMTNDVDHLSCAYISELYNFLCEVLVQVFVHLKKIGLFFFIVYVFFVLLKFFILNRSSF